MPFLCFRSTFDPAADEIEVSSSFFLLSSSSHEVQFFIMIMIIVSVFIGILISIMNFFSITSESSWVKEIDKCDAIQFRSTGLLLVLVVVLLTLDPM